MLDKLRNAIICFKSLIIILKHRFKIVFYSENKSYQKYYMPLINQLKNKNIKILYISSDINDQIREKNFQNIYVGRGLFLTLVFALIRAQKIIFTVTDLGNNRLIRNKTVDQYIYIFHAAVSVHRAYTKKAFNNYDVIFCNGEYQINELRKIEEVNNLKQKKLVESGYLFFDYIKESKNLENKFQDHVLIAPSWNYSDINFFNNCLFEVIQTLIALKKKVILRPHNEHFYRCKNEIDKIKNNFEVSENFFLDVNNDNLKSMQISDFLITDNSGIAIEYFAIFKRPVMYFDEYPKIHNESLSGIDLNCLEDHIKDTFGYKCKKKDITILDKKIIEMTTAFSQKKPLLDEYFKKNFYNFGNSANVYVDKILDK